MKSRAQAQLPVMFDCFVSFEPGAAVTAWEQDGRRGGSVRQAALHFSNFERLRASPVGRLVYGANVVHEQCALPIEGGGI
jgi:hypothetical protein